MLLINGHDANWTLVSALSALWSLVPGLSGLWSWAPTPKKIPGHSEAIPLLAAPQLILQSVSIQQAMKLKFIDIVKIILTGITSIQHKMEQDKTGRETERERVGARESAFDTFYYLCRVLVHINSHFPLHWATWYNKNNNNDTTITMTMTTIFELYANAATLHKWM